MLGFVQSLKILPRWIILVIDIFFHFLSITLAFFLRFNFQVESIDTTLYWNSTLLYIGANVLAIFLTRSYAGIIRYTGLQDGLRIFTTTTLGGAIAFLGSFLLTQITGEVLTSMSGLSIGYFISCIALFAYRLSVKYIFNYYSVATSKTNRVLIFGAGRSGLLTKHLIDNDTRSTMRILGFIEDDSRKVGNKMEGLKVFNARRDLERLIEDMEVDKVIIAIQKLSLARKNELVDICLKHHVQVAHVPPADRWVKGEFSLNQIRQIKIDDLLGRDTIRLNNPNVLSQLEDKTILITGAAGSIGSEIVRQVLSYGPTKVILVDQAESALYDLKNDLFSLPKNSQVVTVVADVTNKVRMRQIFTRYRPEVVYHAAAYKHVPLMESYPAEAVLTNVIGTRNVADLAVEFEVDKFVMISTDKAVNPTNVMGASKRIAEIYIQALDNYGRLTKDNPTHFVTTRFGNVLGSNGSVIPLFKKQIERGGPITVTHPEITRFFMTIPEACQLVLEAGAMGQGGEIYVFDMGQSVKIAELAKKMIKLSGLELDKDIQIKYTGLREGEKLYEELLANEENTQPTHHPKIMIAKVKEAALGEVEALLDELGEYAIAEDEMALVGQMKKIVPEYRSNASRFEKLDNPLPKPTVRR